jgi:HlyD family secretion protein
MKKKIIIISSVFIGLLLISYLLFFRSGQKTTNFTFSKITKGNLNVVITSSGTMEATSTVDVGTQVSGKITKIYVDFNSEVKKGQLLAVLDTVNLIAEVQNAQASLAKARAEYNQKVAIHERNKKLYEKNFISELDFIQSKTDVESTLASFNSAQYSLEKAKTNLSYAFIYAPISGKIISRSVEVGQTVAASLSAPTLFVIAEDLSSMRILANVDESDIGQIKEGQKVKFTVQTYSDKSFEGVVTQIRLLATTTSNVVNYTVVIHADNKDGALLPGMTATVDFCVDQRENVLLVPNTALRFEPSEELSKEINANMKKDMANIPDDIKAKFKGGPPMMPGGFSSKISKTGTNNMEKVYFLDGNGKVKMVPVFIGLTDGKNSEIIMGPVLKEGMSIITGSSESSTTAKKSSTLTGGPQGGPPMM